MTCLTIPAVVWKCLNFNVQMFQEFVHFYCVVFSHVVYHIYSVGKGLNLCIFDMFDHICSGLKKSKFLWVFALLFTIPRVVWKSLNFVCTNVPRICSLLLYSFFAYGLSYLQWLDNRSKFVYFWHLWPYLQWSEKV